MYILEPVFSGLNLSIVTEFNEPFLGQNGQMFNDLFAPTVVFMTVANEYFRASHLSPLILAFM